MSATRVMPRSLSCVLGLLLLASAVLFAPRALAQAPVGCTAGACVTAGPRLVSVDSTQGPLLNLLFQTLLPGTTVNMTFLDWDGLADADINLNALVTQLGTNLSLSDPSQVLNANITLAQLRLAMVQVLQADGNTAAVNALNILTPTLAGVTGTIKLGDLLKVTLPQGSLADIDLDVLDLITGSVQLYNFKNVLTTPAPVTLNTAALGLAGVANVQLWLQIVEPPVYVCGPVNTQFYSAAVRAKLNLEVLNGFNLQPAINAINALGLTNISNVSLAQGALVLDLYADIARAQGTISQVNALAQTVTVQAEPGIVDLYIGEIADSTFFNRTETIEATDFTRKVISTLDLSLNVTVPILGLPTVVDVQVPLTVYAFAAAEGNPGPETLVFNGSYPETKKVDSGAVSAGTLVTSLLNNLNIDVVAGDATATVLGIEVSLGVLTGIINNVINPIVTVVESTLQATSSVVLQPVLNTVLGGLIDPLLRLLGIGLGEAVVTVEGIGLACTADLSISKSDGSATYSPGGSATYAITVSNAGPAAVTGATVSDTLPNGVTLSGPWTCAVTLGIGTCSAASGGAAGNQAVNLTVDLDAGGQATINVPVTFSANSAAY